MAILRFSASFSILVFLSLFVQANQFQTESTSGTFGTIYLYCALLSFIAAIVFSGDIASFLSAKKKHIFANYIPLLHIRQVPLRSR